MGLFEARGDEAGCEAKVGGLRRERHEATATAPGQWGGRDGREWSFGFFGFLLLSMSFFMGPFLVKTGTLQGLLGFLCQFVFFV